MGVDHDPSSNDYYGVYSSARSHDRNDCKR